MCDIKQSALFIHTRVRRRLSSIQNEEMARQEKSSNERNISLEIPTREHGNSCRKRRDEEVKKMKTWKDQGKIN